MPIDNPWLVGGLEAVDGALSECDWHEGMIAWRGIQINTYHNTGK